mgnify:CR=1 FL=1
MNASSKAHGQHVGYVRVSTADQNTDRQLDGIELARTFTDRASGGSTNRPALTDCLAFLREGDTLHVHSIDRLARSLVDLERIVADLNARGVAMRFEKEGMTFAPGNGSDPMKTLLRQVLASFAQFERAMIRERQREGIEAAKARGVYKGRKRALTESQEAEVRARLEAGETKTAIAKELGLTRETVYQILRRGSAS